MPELATFDTQPSETPRRQRRKREIRARILESAAALFEERGCKAATVVDICRRADVAKASFFNHFPSKQDLLCELAVAVFDDLVADVARARSEQGDTASALRTFFRTIASQMSAAGPTAREFTAELIRATQDAGFESDESKRLHQAFAQLIEDGRARGDVNSPHKNETLAEMIGAVYYGLIMGWVQNESYEIERKAGEAAAFLADAITIKENGHGST